MQEAELRKPVIIVLIISAISMSFYGMKTANMRNPDSAMVEILMDYVDLEYSEFDFEEFLYVGVKRQKLYHIKQGHLVRAYDISTSAKGAGNRLGSNQTPIGLHSIKERIGHTIPIGGRFVGKKYTGEVCEILRTPIDTDKDDITTRILSLQGMENDVNTGDPEIDSYHRRIYIHGTPEEGLIGKPASHGCVRMRNTDVIDLFDKSFEGMLVLILDN